MRRDLPLGTIAAQVAHAAGSSSDRHPDGTYVVVLSTESEKDLRDLSSRLLEAKIPYKEVCEVDEPYAGSMMAIGIDLVRDRSKVQRVVSSLPLLKEKS